MDEEEVDSQIIQVCHNMLVIMHRFYKLINEDGCFSEKKTKKLLIFVLWTKMTVNLKY